MCFFGNIILDVKSISNLFKSAKDLIECRLNYTFTASILKIDDFEGFVKKGTAFVEFERFLLSLEFRMEIIIFV